MIHKQINFTFTQAFQQTVCTGMAVCYFMTS